MSPPGRPRARSPRRFHRTIARATVDALLALAADHGTDVVVLSGGVFQNRRLLESVSDGLSIAGLRVLVPERLPVNDGGIAYGQAAVAAALLAMSDLRPDPRAAGVHPRRQPPVRRAHPRGRGLPRGRAARRGRVRADRASRAGRAAWRELSIAMDRAGAGTVGDLGPDVLVELAPKLWVTLPR